MEDNTVVMNRAIDLAEKWQLRAADKISNFEKNFHEKMKKMFARPLDKVLLIDLMDQSFRTKNTARVADQVEYIFTKYGMATFFSTPEKFLIFLFRNIGVYLPDISVPLFIKSVRDDTDTTVYVENTDYTINYDKGTITAIAGGAITAGDTVHTTYDNTAYKAWTIAAFTTKAATGKLRLEACAVEGMDIEYTFEKITLKLNGSFSIVSAEDFASLALQATVLSDDLITDPSKSKIVNIRGDDLFA